MILETYRMGPEIHKNREDLGKAKLFIAEVKEIKRLLKKSDLTSKQIAKLYGVSGSCINSIKRGVSWNNVTLEPDVKAIE